MSMDGPFCNATLIETLFFIVFVHDYHYRVSECHEFVEEVLLQGLLVRTKKANNI